MPISPSGDFVEAVQVALPLLDGRWPVKYEPADLGQLSGYLAMAEHVLNVPGDNPPVGVLVPRTQSGPREDPSGETWAADGHHGL